MLLIKRKYPPQKTDHALVSLRKKITKKDFTCSSQNNVCTSRILGDEKLICVYIVKKKIYYYLIYNHFSLAFIFLRLRLIFFFHLNKASTFILWKLLFSYPMKSLYHNSLHVPSSFVPLK